MCTRGSMGGGRDVIRYEGKDDRRKVKGQIRFEEKLSKERSKK